MTKGVAQHAELAVRPPLSVMVQGTFSGIELYVLPLELLDPPPQPTPSNITDNEMLFIITVRTFYYPFPTKKPGRE
jgi:hypothetical protein